MESFNYLKEFNRNKSAIIEVLVASYGEEYRSIISRRINNTYFDFSSLPIYDTIQAVTCMSLDENDIRKVKLHQLVYSSTLSEIMRISDAVFITYLKKILNLNAKVEQAFYDSSFLDFFRGILYEEAEIDKFINNQDDEIATSYIVYAYKSLCDYLSISSNELNVKSISDVIKCRRELQESIKPLIGSEIFACKKTADSIKKQYNIDIPQEELSSLVLSSESFSTYRKYGSEFLRFVKVPINFLKQHNLSCDLIFLHELIHIIESNIRDGITYCGIAYIDANADYNRLLNEIRTQLKAIDIFDFLHQQDVYIFDDPNNKKINTYCSYEKYFSMAKPFLEKYSSLIDRLSITGEASKMEKIFGKSFNEFSAFFDNQSQSLNSPDDCYSYVRTLTARMDDDYSNNKLVRKSIN